MQSKKIFNFRHAAIFFSVQAFSIICFSQLPKLKFTRLNTGNGLSQNSVFSIEKDYKGFMWFATNEGLNKYDGYKFTVFKHDPEIPASLSNSSVFNVKEDAAHNLWILTKNGLDRFDRTTETFVHCITGHTWEEGSNIFQDGKKRIWVGSPEGFCLFNIATSKYKFYKNNPADSNSLSQNFVYKITEDNDGQLWIGTRNGLNRFDPETEHFTRYLNQPGNPKSIGSGFIKTVYKDRKGNIWAGTQGNGIALFNRSDNSFINYRHVAANPNSISYNDILSFTEDASGKLWIGTENGGISVYDYATNNFTAHVYDGNDPFSISDNSIYCLYKDDIGNIWAGTWSGGISFLPLFGDKFKSYKKDPFNTNSLSNNLVLSLSNDADNNIWIGTDGGGLNQFNPLTRSFKNYRKITGGNKGIYNDYVLTATPYSLGNLLIGFHRGGIDFLNVNKNTFTHYGTEDVNFNRLTSLSVKVAYRDKRSNLWLNNDGYGGIFLFDEKTKIFTPFLPDSNNNKSIASVRVYAIYETRKGQLWIGGDNGLDLFDRDKKEFIHRRNDPKNKRSLSDNDVNCIAEDDKGNLWLGTSGGLNYYDLAKDQFTVYTEKDGLSNNTVLSIQLDRHGNLWMGTNKGLSNFNPVTKVFRNYLEADGLLSNTFKHQASCQSLDGEMFFGGVNGFNAFYPDSIRDNNFIPPIFITGFQVFNKSVGIGENSPLKQNLNDVKEIRLSYSQSVFTFEFSALNFTNTEQNQYAYVLEGFDDDWNYSGNKRTATYTNLNPGTYTFKVKGSNNDGVWNESGASVTIIITPPFWKTWWFRILGLLVITASILGYYKVRVYAIQQQKIKLQQKVNEQTIQLIRLNEDEHSARMEAEQSKAESEVARQQANIANIALQLKNKELEQFAYVASHDLQEPLRTTVGFVELLQIQLNGKLDEKANKYLNFIADAAKRMRVLITDLLDFSRIGSKENQERVDCNVIMENVLSDILASATEANAVIKYETLPVIDGFPTEIKLLFQNLLANAIKFRKKNIVPLIKITVEKEKDFWKFAVIDNGIGIKKEYSEKIFDIFQRLNVRSEYQGSGIGLAHCKKIVELHGGKIWMESVPGEGSTFLFTIP